MITPEQREVIKRCQGSAIWFMEHFVKIKHPSAGIIKFHPFSYQRKAVKAFRNHRMNIFRKTRQAGISKLTGVFALWFAMFHSHKTVLIVSKTDNDAMNFLAEHIRLPYDYLPEWMKKIWVLIGDNAHEISFPNNSVIRSLTSAQDVLRSNASSLNIIDEAAFILHMDALWAGGWPTLQHGGCSRPDTLVLTERGLVELGSLGDTAGPTWQDIDVAVATDRGRQRASKFYVNGVVPTRIITTASGYGIESSHDHRLRVVDATGSYAWKRVTDIEVGDYLPVRVGGYPADLPPAELAADHGLPAVLEDWVAEFLGLCHGAGVLTGDRLEFSCNRAKAGLRERILEHLGRLGQEPVRRRSGSSLKVAVESPSLAAWLRGNGLWPGGIPAAILAGPRPALGAYLRGLFAAAGTVHYSPDYAARPRVCLLLANRTRCRQAHVALLALGIVCRLSLGRGRRAVNRLYLARLADIIAFRDRVGAIADLDRARLMAVDIDVPGLANGRQRRLLAACTGLPDDSFYLDRVRSVRDGEGDTYDLTVEPDHCYVANGLVSHNSVIVISTTNGIGGWYWGTYTDAEAGLNNFNPIVVNWWDMDWSIEYVDSLSRRPVRICPREGIRPCKTKEEKDKYGPYWSPWLEDQYRELQQRGEAWKFNQEVLAEFVGSGNTVLSKAALMQTGETVDHEFERVTGMQVYVNPVSGEQEEIDFTPAEPTEGLWIWRKPVAGVPNKIAAGRIVEMGTPAHAYVIGVDLATGKGRDYHGLEVIDVTTLEQAAEMMFRCLPMIFAKIVDRVGRWYNNALLVVERNNGGDQFIDDLRNRYMYPRLWRKATTNDRPGAKSRRTGLTFAHYGHFTSDASKAVLNKCLLDNVREDDNGVKIYSSRLHKQLQIYVRKRTRDGRDTRKTEAEDGAGNYDDLVMALGLALLGMPDAAGADVTTLQPVHAGSLPTQPGPGLKTAPTISVAEQQRHFAGIGGQSLLMPMALAPEATVDQSIIAELERYAAQLSTTPQALPTVSRRRHGF